MTASDWPPARRPGPQSAGAMSDTLDPAATEEAAPHRHTRPPLAEKALGEAFGRLRYRDTSLLIWQQQQLEAAPPPTYLSRSQSAWYSNYGNQAVLIRDRRGADEGRSRICNVM